MKKMPSSSALDPLEGVPVFQIGVSVGQDLEGLMWQQKKFVRIFCVTTNALLKNYFVREVGCFHRAGYNLLVTHIILIFQTTLLQIKKMYPLKYMSSFCSLLGLISCIDFSIY